MTASDYCLQNQPFPVGIYLLKVSDRNTRTKCEICSELTIKTQERRQWHSSGVFNVNFGHISHIGLVLLMLTLNMQLPAGFRFLDLLVYLKSVFT